MDASAPGWPSRPAGDGDRKEDWENHGEGKGRPERPCVHSLGGGQFKLACGSGLDPLGRVHHLTGFLGGGVWTIATLRERGSWWNFPLKHSRLLGYRGAQGLG